MNVPKQYWPFVAAVVVGLAGFAAGDWSLMAWLLALAIACGGVIAIDTRWGILATSTLGFGCSAYLFSRKLESATGPALCNVNDVINCDVVNSSPSSEVFGIPIGLLGAGFFLGTAIAAAIARDASARLHATTLILSSLGVVYSIYLAGVAVSIGAVCVMCITIYLACGLLVWAGYRGITADGRQVGDAIPQVPTSISFVVISLTLVVVTLVGMSTYSGSKRDVPEITGVAPAPAPEGDPVAPRPANGQEYVESFAYSSPIELAGTEPVLGDRNAPYLVVEFADFACPHCADAAALLKPLVAQEPDIQVHFRPFALSGACNPALESKEGVDRCFAAFGAECANLQDKFWEYSNLLFANQRDLSNPVLMQIAEQVGLDVDKWLACMQDPATHRSVQASAIAGARAGIHGTPSFFVKGLDGERWVQVCGGPPDLLGLVQLHKSGVPLPTPSQTTCH